ncbi:hypothetical protein OBBRIDRAFT_795115 [Obba rivulosa]|uniref:Uncharacterized protein n=1 Tax=Obba rivulosa TaxID=1052685 RepID=A0A8E2DMW5_9APHY|nr:hypothetical protein OBBRIDRAFT_795115 [Obba rivulosa]
MQCMRIRDILRASIVTPTRIPRPTHISQSKDCQRAAWPKHKPSCKRHSEAFAYAQSKGLPHPAKSLQKYANLHMPVLSEAAARALNVAAEPARPASECLMLTLRPMPRPRLFFLADAQVWPFGLFEPAEARKMRAAWEEAHRQSIAQGGVGAVIVALRSQDTNGGPGVVHFAVFGFDESVKELRPMGSWQDWLKKQLNPEL